MYSPADFRPTASRFAFVPVSLRYLPETDRHFSYKIMGYWWSGNPRRRVLHYGHFNFDFEAQDDRLLQYRDVDFEQVMKIAANYGMYNGGERPICHYSIWQDEYANYDGRQLRLTPEGANWKLDTGPLVAFYDSLATDTPLTVPVGARGWYAQGAAADEIEQRVLGSWDLFFYPPGERP